MDVLWRHNGVILEPTMPVNLSIKDAPDDIVELVRERAQKNHRSLRGELLAIIEEAVRKPRQARMSIDDVLAQGRRLGLSTPDDSVAIARSDRDSG
jgi:plasmid stability protein